MRCRCPELSKPIRTLAELDARGTMGSVIEPLLVELASNARTWMSVLRCRACGTTWVCEYPYSELHGGGPACYYQAPISDPQGWLVTAQPQLDRIRQAAEDRAFFANLGVERGPERCRHPGCPKLRISHSALCRAHHFENVLGRPAPAADE